MQFDLTNINKFPERTQLSNTTTLSGYLGGMDHSDVPFVYHHLRKGCILSLSSITSCTGKHLLFGVNYGAYRIGTLSSTMARKIQELQIRGMVYRITISQVVKEKYLPPTAIIVEIQYENDFLADVA